MLRLAGEFADQRARVDNTRLAGIASIVIDMKRWARALRSIERQPPFRGPLYHLYEKELVSLSNSYAFQSTFRRTKPTGSALDERNSS